MKTTVNIYHPVEDPEYFKEYPHDKWRCSIFTSLGTNHNGSGANIEQAVGNAVEHLISYMAKK